MHLDIFFVTKLLKQGDLNMFKLPSRFVLSGLIFLCTTFGGQNLSVAQRSSNQFVETVKQQLIKAAQAAVRAGFRLTHDPFVDRLGNGGNDDITLNLRKGTSYVIVGVCDDDCKDMDLKLYDDNGRLVDSDTAADDTPIAIFR